MHKYELKQLKQQIEMHHQEELNKMNKQIELLIDQNKIMKEESAHILKAKIEKKLQKKQKQIKQQQYEEEEKVRGEDLKR